MGGARIYTAPSGTGGTYGFFLPAIPVSESLTATTSSLQIFGMNSGDSNFRTNLDVTNTSGVDLGIEVRVIDPATGESYGGPQDFTVAAKSLLRLGQILVTAGAPAIPGLRITVAVEGPFPAHPEASSPRPIPSTTAPTTPSPSSDNRPPRTPGAS